jgi:tetratricopeptide (TPR) repeat protein
VTGLAHGDAAARDDCEAAARIELETPTEFVERGDLMRRACKLLDQALADYGRAIELARAWAEPYLWRSWTYSATERFEEALADATTAVELQPRWTQAVFNRGEYLVSLDRLDEAIEDMKRALDIAGSTARMTGGRSVLSEILVRVGREDEAFELLDQAIALYPGDGGLRLARARRLFEVGRIEEAIAAFGEAVEAEPGSPWHYAFRALARTFAPSECESARADLDRALELGALNGTTASLIARTHVVGLAPQCPELFDAALALDLARKGEALPVDLPVDEEGTLVLALYRAGRYAEARTLFEHHRRYEPPELFTAALVYRRLGRLDDARRAYDDGRARMARYFARDPIALRLEGEAAELLGAGI